MRISCKWVATLKLGGVLGMIVLLLGMMVGLLYAFTRGPHWVCVIGDVLGWLCIAFLVAVVLYFCVMGWRDSYDECRKDRGLPTKYEKEEE